PGRLVDYFDPELRRLLELAPSTGPGDHQVRLRAYRSRGLGAEPFGLSLGFVAAHRLQLAGEHHGLAADRALLGLYHELRRINLAQQVVPDLAVVLLVEEVAERLDHYRPHAFDAGQFGQRFRIAGVRFLCCLAQGREGVKPLEQIARRDCAHVTNAEAEQQPRGIGPALGFDGCQQVVHRLVLPALPADQLRAVSVQPEQIARPLRQPAELEELGNRLLAQPLDVERAPAGEMPQPLELLRPADQPAGAAHVHFAFLRDSFAAADRAEIGEHKRLARLLARQVLDHLRNDVAGALQHDAV